METLKKLGARGNAGKTKGKVIRLFISMSVSIIPPLYILLDLFPTFLGLL